jgi:hypothetical protein
MSSGVDEDTLIALVVGLAAAAALAFAVNRFARGRHVAGVLLSVGATMLALVAWFFAAFTIRMF